MAIRSANGPATPAPDRRLPNFAPTLWSGLSHPGQKELPSKYLYDEVGSALFDVICLLPEYGLSRAGMRLLQRHSAEDRRPLAESGGGGGTGQRQRAENALAAGSARAPAARELLPDRYFRQRALSLPAGTRTDGHGEHRRFRARLSRRACRKWRRGAAKASGCSCFSSAARSGTSIDPPAISSCAKCGRFFATGDALLLATDLEKPVPMLTLGLRRSRGRYGRVQQESARAHQSRARCAISICRVSSTWCATMSRSAASKCTCARRPGSASRFAKPGFRFYMREGETIWTESSHKYDPEEVIQMGERTGYRCAGQWFDSEWPFAQNLFFAV